MVVHSFYLNYRVRFTHSQEGARPLIVGPQGRSAAQGGAGAQLG